MQKNKPAPLLPLAQGKKEFTIVPMSKITREKKLIITIDGKNYKVDKTVKNFIDKLYSERSELNIFAGGLKYELDQIAEKLSEMYPERMKEFNEKNFTIMQATLDVLNNRDKLITNIDIKDVKL